MVSDDSKRIQPFIHMYLFSPQGLPWWLRGKESAGSAGAAGDLGSIPESGRSPGKGNGNPLQHSCLENPIDRGDSPWTKEPGRLQTMGSQRVGHD